MKMDVFIGFDEDDDNDHKIDLNQLFGVDAGAKPYSVEVNVLAHYNIKELIIDSVDQFNHRLEEQGAVFCLDGNQE